MATPADADIVLKLYELRREPVMREARDFLRTGFQPQTPEEFSAIHQATHPHNAHWRQVISFWELAANLALHGGVDLDLFVATSTEPFFYRAKFAELSEAATGNTFMPNTLKVIEKSEEARKRFEGAKKTIAARKAAEDN